MGQADLPIEKEKKLGLEREISTEKAPCKLFA